MTVWVVLIILTGVVVYVGFPLFRRRKGGSGTLSDSDSLAHLYENRDTLIRSLKDLEFDFQMGRISEEDFREGNSWYRREAVEVLRDIDSLERDGEAVCRACGAAVSKGDRFCAHCGTRLQGKGPPGSDENRRGAGSGEP